MKQEKEIIFNGDFEDSEEEDDDQSQEYESDEELNKKKKKKSLQNTNKNLIMNVSDTQYPVVKFVGKMIYKFKLQYVPYQEINNWDFCWTDNAVLPETLAKMQSHQKINHFPGMYSLARKNHLGKNLNKMQKQFPEEYDFYPRTWMLPSEYNDFKQQFGKAKTFILKPEASCQGRGIFLTRCIEQINPTEHYVAQRYIHKPLLIDGLKFDLRMYVLICGCDPLRLYLYKEGLARFATQAYIAPNTNNLDDVCMHLTNYAINKDNPNFIFNSDEKKMDVGHKRSMSSVFELLREQNQNVDQLLDDIKDLIIKTFCSVQPILQSNYTQVDNYANNMCFEILGFDILIDSSLKPYLLEVNHTPSFTADTPLDQFIKKSLIADTITLMNINLKTKNESIQQKKDEMQKRVLTGKKLKLSIEEKKLIKLQFQKQRDEYEQQNKGNYELIYPCSKSYEEYLQHSLKIYEEWTGANIRRNQKKEFIQINQETQNKSQSQPKKIILEKKSTLYKHVQSKINTNLFPNNKNEQIKGDEVIQEGEEQPPNQINTIPEVDNDHFFPYEDYQQQSLESIKDLCTYTEKRGQELQILDLIQFRKTDKRLNSSHNQQQNVQSILSPLSQIKGVLQGIAIKNVKQFQIKNNNKNVKSSSKQINESEQDKFQENPQKQQIMQSQQNYQQSNPQGINGAYIKPKVFSLKLSHPPKGYKLQSLPLLIQQNFTKYRYE
ncbi:unnamed protein product [Paramecium sonneborni]|uniref:Tubulin-tyrosine ligase family protein n=1 Tax=Paramecium sonneborni TaxID=65129 RepID=A0A8S1LBB2_9CILI|nr:unnamed protein product [Paramecium sonneborni]